MDTPRRHLLLALAAALPACNVIPRPAPPPPGTLAEGFVIDRSLPTDLPQGATPFGHSQFVLLASENALVLLVPVPFVGEAVKGVVDAQAAARYETRFGELDPHRLALRAWQGSPRVLPAGRPRVASTPVLRPFAFVQESADGRFRVALVHRIDAPGWVGRYMVHLRTTYTTEAMSAPTPAMLSTLAAELADGCRVARTIVERDLDGGFARPIGTVDVGSLHLVGGRSSGVMPPELQHARDGDLLDEDAEHVVVRLQGIRSMPAASGGLLFGIHRLRKDQLHHYRRIAGTPAQRTA
jgi:hypothetical protein